MTASFTFRHETELTCQMSATTVCQSFHATIRVCGAQYTPTTMTKYMHDSDILGLHTILLINNNELEVAKWQCLPDIPANSKGCGHHDIIRIVAWGSTKGQYSNDVAEAGPADTSTSANLAERSLHGHQDH